VTPGSDWYRSGGPAPRVTPPIARRIRNWLRDRLPDPDVRGKTMVMYCRQGVRKSRAWPGMFSEVIHVLGGLKYAEMHRAAAVRVDFRSPHYLDPERGPNWWTYFFESDTMPVDGDAGAAEVHLTSPISKYGKYGGFCDLVNGETPHLYPMTFGIDRAELGRLFAAYIRIRPEILAKVERFATEWLTPGEKVIGVSYRGTDSARHYPFYRLPYEAFADEVRRVADADARLLVTSDEVDFVEFMEREFPGRVTTWSESPRVRAGETAIHFNRGMQASGYLKGESALIDCVLLSRTDYLVKGRSNISDVALVLNPRLPYSFCVR